MFWVWRIIICQVSLAENFYAVFCSWKLDSLLWSLVILVNLYFASNKPILFLTIWPWLLPPFEPVESINEISKLMKSSRNFPVFWHRIIWFCIFFFFLGFSAKPKVTQSDLNTLVSGWQVSGSWTEVLQVIIGSWFSFKQVLRLREHISEIRDIIILDYLIK